MPDPSSDPLRIARVSAVSRSLVLPVAATLAVQTFVALAVYCAPVMAPVVGPALGLPPAHVGYYIAVVYLGSMLGSVTGGGWVARWGAIRVSQLGLALCLAGLVFGASGFIPLVLLGGLFVGLGYGPSTPASSHILVRASPPRLIAFVFSLKQTGVPVGCAIAGAVVPALVLATGWQAAAITIGVACFALAVVIEPTRTRFDRELDPQARVSFASMFAPLGLVKNPRLAEMAVASFIYCGVQITLLTYLVTFLTETFATSLVLAGMVMAVSQLASVIGRIAWGVVADRLLTRRTMLGLLGIGMGISALAPLAASAAWPIWLLFAYAAVFGATAVGWNGVFLAEVARLAPKDKTSEATGACLFFTYLGSVCAPPLFNLAISIAGGYAGAYAVFGVPALLVGAWLLVRRG
ncbi:MAG: MFS transporter [Deltaproteobacteria bacterium]|nr:MFS transporter [Deltaproteobacteria bacterium]